MARELELERFPQDVINYALENVQVDYFEQAVLKAEIHNKIIPM